MAMEIFPGLPDDIGRLCLLRMPLTSHPTMALVCKRWKNIICNPLFYQDRKRFGLSQKLTLYDNYYDTITIPEDRRLKLSIPLQKLSKTLAPYPSQFPFFSSRCSYYVPFKHKLFVVKLTNPTALIIYDFSSGIWKLGPKVPECRQKFCCSLDSDKGLIYIAGKDCTAAFYDIEEEKWGYLPRMISSGSDCHSVFTDGKFYVATRMKWLMEGRIDAYDATTRQWSAICNCRYPEEQSFAAFARIYYDLFRASVSCDFPMMPLTSTCSSRPRAEERIQMEL